MTAAEAARSGERAWYFEDWVNPVLMKEVRQALRGKYFKVCFWLTLLAVTVVTTGILVVNGDDGHIDAREGREFVFGIFFCLAVAVIGLVPFSAFNAMGAEWDENTFDLLIISNVRPHGIVLGKLLSSGVQTLIVYSAFTPYLVLASLMQGVDLNSVAVLLGFALFFSLILSLVAICLSTLSRVRFARVMLQATLSVVLVAAVSTALPVANFVIEEPGMLHSPETPYAILSILVACLVVAAYSFGIACVMLSHAEENRSTGMRILTTACLAGVIGWMWAMSNIAPRDGIWMMSIAVLVAMVVPMVFFVTEAERLPRRVAPRIPARRAFALLLTPYLPGGARGFLYFLLHLAVLSVSVALIADDSMGGLFGTTAAGSGLLHGPATRAALFALAGGAMYAVIYLGLPSAILAPFSGHPTLRAAARASIPFVIGAFAFLPAVLGFFIDDPSLMGMRHAGNPVYLLVLSFESGPNETRGIWVLLTILVLATLAANVPRIWRAFGEVARDSRARAAREATAHAARIAAGAPEGTRDAVA